MRINNAQLKLLIPLVLKASQDTPHLEWDLLLENLIECAYSRRSSVRPEHIVPKELIKRDGSALHVTGQRGIAKKRKDAGRQDVAGRHPLMGP